jgi:HEPN domain-containing protein
MVSRAQDWFRQALRDLEQAEDSRRAGRHEWACFAAQQASEKAIVGLNRFLGRRGQHIVISRLLQELSEKLPVSPELIEKGKVLDNFYIPARYPNSHPAGAPFEHYGPLQGDMAVDYARAILDFVRLHMAG